MLTEKNRREKELQKRAIKIIKALTCMYPHAKVFLNYSNPFELLVAVMLSAQCTDKKVNEVTEKLFKKYKTIDDYVKAGRAEKTVLVFENDIRQTGFFRVKAKHILLVAKIIQEKYKGMIPDNMEELTALPGVGRKTANIILESAFGIVVGIPVDTHVFRLAHRFGLSKQKTPDGVEKDLCRIIPKRYWAGLSYKLISYGREYCPARAHDHALCPLSKIGV
ncbi:MAG: endonuclease III [Parcubacteria group bacterium LiPW_41]|nr:MAG: endonuclease III [Parcubacteria group bacterium LiPW_41]